jgi:hypothetical protein
MGTEDRMAALRALIDGGLTFGEAQLAFCERQGPEAVAFIERAKQHPQVEEGVLEVDSTAMVSIGGDGVAYVQAWLYID